MSPARAPCVGEPDEHYRAVRSGPTICTPVTLRTLLLLASVAACATVADLDAQTPPDPPAAALSAAPTDAAAIERPSFPQFLDTVRGEALARGIKASTVDAAFTELEPLPVVVERDRTQAEFKLDLDAYIKRRLTPHLMRDTRRQLAQHHDLLAKIADQYGVPATTIVAVWALESNLGRFTGVRPTVAALATLAWDGRRPFFRSELLDALTIIDRGDIEPEHLRGSWAGAMGQVQFMPSSYLKYAQDFDGDGRKDIWTSSPDVFASIANYLKENGWTSGQPWGREATVTAAAQDAVMLGAPLRTEGCRAERDMTVPLSLSQWQDLGVRGLHGRALPKAELNASLVTAGTRRFLVYPNYGAILRYNCANAYALTVGVLADRLAASHTHH